MIDVDKFAVFILSHGRAKNVQTFNTLRRCGYTGKIYILIDNEDLQAEDYFAKYGNQVILFDKKEAKKITDSGNNFGKNNSVVFARNKNFEIAKNLGLDYFWQLDDDYSGFGYVIDDKKQYLTSDKMVKNLNKLLYHCIEFMKSTNVDCIAWAQGGDLMGGENGEGVRFARTNKFKRKIMNSFLIDVNKPFKFVGMMNDDVNTYVTLGQRGKIFVTTYFLRLDQAPTQQNDGGLTSMYLENGTYVKSFYTVMMAPSCTTITMMGVTQKRWHHKINWNYCVPKILSEKHKKRL